MERVIVTGANGFIGRNFIRLLVQKGIDVYAIDMSHNNTTLGSLNNVYLLEKSLDKLNELKDELANIEFDTFYHFAWAGTTGPVRADYVLQSQNAIYTCDAALLSKKLGCKKFVTTGTITEKIAENILVNHYQSENLIYGLSKLYTHNLLDIVCNKYDINYVWAKLSNIYGGDNTNGNLISYTMKEFKEGHKPKYGPCLQPYNFTYIDDVIEALYVIGSKENKKHEYLISNGECKTLKDYLEDLANIYGKEVSIGERADDGVRYDISWFKDNSLKNDFGFEAKYSFTKGIEKIRGEQ
jgi:UDP-glucose 4-epimerase